MGAYPTPPPPRKTSHVVAVAKGVAWALGFVAFLVLGVVVIVSALIVMVTP